ncbi:MAG: indole-3-glycerol phosphate synthase TrpC [Leptolyngbya sp. PLA1]|nr:indole-3-glycerol phosphate synthase TrpC [Leptolyngbya sp. PLA1]
MEPTPHQPTPAVLAEIVAHKREEIARGREATPLEELRARVAGMPRPRNFFTAVTRQPRLGTRIIAEVKRKSPSAGWMRPEYAGEGFRPEDIASRYHRAGAAAISCLTDERYFGGHLSYIERIRAAVPLPVLRKDFIVDPWQVWESRAAGADAVLLIAECLTLSELSDLLILSHELGLTTLLEAHGKEQVRRVLDRVGFPLPSYALLGINNRDLTTMRVDLDQTLRLAELVEDTTILVSESGIRTPADLTRLRGAGVRIALVGEHLMKAEDPGRALAELLARDPAKNDHGS